MADSQQPELRTVSTCTPSIDASQIKEPTIETAIEHAKRAFALRKYEEAVDHYATALELATQEYGDDSPATADLYFAYGKALLENAVAQSAVLGRDQADDALEMNGVENQAGPSGSGPFLSFSGDPEDDRDALLPEGEDVPVDLFAEAIKQDEEDDEEGEGEEGEDGEPEDDFNAAWEVLDLARTIYDRVKDADKDGEVKLKLADTYIALGDVSLETEKFDQAIMDYTAGVELKSELLPQSSRQIAEAHYKLSIVLDLTSGRLADAITHAEAARASVEARLEELMARRSVEGQSGLVQNGGGEEKTDLKGKGKAVSSKGSRLYRDEEVRNMSQTQVDAEIKELEGLKEDLTLKVEELKLSPTESSTISAPALAAKALDADLNAPPASAPSTVVNDLTSMVVKKKKVKAPEESVQNGVKRKAEDAPEIVSASEKKTKVEQ